MHPASQTLGLLATAFAIGAGAMDLRWRRIPNWWTLPGLLVGLTGNAVLAGWPGAKTGLLGAGLGLLLLLPFVFVRSLGAGDWKLVGALGAFIGPSHLIRVLVGSIFVAGVMALVLVIWSRRFLETVQNIGHMLAAFFTLRLPGPAVSLDNPRSAKVPFGVAVALAMALYGATGFSWGVF
jgi:prepilin peptidase CpaA